MTFLQVLWFLLIAVLWTGYLVLEGFGVGSGMLLRILGHNDAERSQIIRTYGPVWDGNEVWLLTAGGATFAAFPEWYATMFAGMYLALFAILVALIVRICAIEWRIKVASLKWRNFWDWCQFIATWFVPLLFGVAFANLIAGMAIEVADPRDLTQVVPAASVTPEALASNVHNITGGFFSLLTPFTLLGGVMLVSVFLAQGSLWLSIRTTGVVHDRAQAISRKLTILSTALVAVFALNGQFFYSSQPVYGWIPLVVAALAIIAAAAAANTGKELQAFLLHSVAIAGAVSFVFVSMAPYVMKSSIDPAYSLNIAQAASSEATLTVMTIVAVVLVPVVLGYTAWAYSRLGGPVSVDDIDTNPGLPWANIRRGANFLNG